MPEYSATAAEISGSISNLQRPSSPENTVSAVDISAREVMPARSPRPLTVASTMTNKTLFGILVAIDLAILALVLHIPILVLICLLIQRLQI